jgi:hypothetical protein
MDITRSQRTQSRSSVESRDWNDCRDEEAVVAQIRAELEEFAIELPAAGDPLQLKAMRDGLVRLQLTLRSHRGAEALQAAAHAAELRLRSERALGEWLRNHLSRGGDRRSPQRSESLLQSLNISYRNSSEWQRMGAIASTAFDSLIATLRSNGQALSTAALLRASSVPASHDLQVPPANPLSPHPQTVSEDLVELRDDWRQLTQLLEPLLSKPPRQPSPEACRYAIQLMENVRKTLIEIHPHRPSC